MRSQEVKGKQVQILCELVTVNGEYTAFLLCFHGKVTEFFGKACRYASIRKSGNLPECWYRKYFIFKSRGLDCTVFLAVFFGTVSFAMLSAVCGGLFLQNTTLPFC